MKTRQQDVQLEGIDNDSGRAEGANGGQSGDSQGLPQTTDVASESVEELAESGQTYEAELLEGLEEAADHPEVPVHTREDQSRSPELPPLPGSD
jgi:hypothetical protein